MNADQLYVAYNVLGMEKFVEEFVPDEGLDEIVVDWKGLPSDEFMAMQPNKENENDG